MRDIDPADPLGFWPLDVEKIRREALAGAATEIRMVGVGGGSGCGAGGADFGDESPAEIEARLNRQGIYFYDLRDVETITEQGVFDYLGRRILMRGPGVRKALGILYQACRDDLREFWRHRIHPLIARLQGRPEPDHAAMEIDSRTHADECLRRHRERCRGLAGDGGAAERGHPAHQLGDALGEFGQPVGAELDPDRCAAGGKAAEPGGGGVDDVEMDARVSGKCQGHGSLLRCGDAAEDSDGEARRPGASRRSGEGSPS